MIEPRIYFQRDYNRNYCIMNLEGNISKSLTESCVIFASSLPSCPEFDDVRRVFLIALNKIQILPAHQTCPWIPFVSKQQNNYQYKE